MKEIIQNLKGSFVVSCQALEHEPLYGSRFMAQMAVAVVEGGAQAIRANGPDDIRAIKAKVRVPIIGLYKKEYSGCEVYITPTINEVKAIVEAGADIIAFDATNRPRPDGKNLEEFIGLIKERYPDIPLMADIATLEEGIVAAHYRVDVVSTTMSGYTGNTRHINTFDRKLLRDLIRTVDIPIAAEGRILTPEEAACCMKSGAHLVVVGTAITRPQEITKLFYHKLYPSLRN
ncbi:N-acetylmannosamine-6-phosphate 2-epimerase [Bacillus sp. SD088]|uniref:N-acetylmannosamine-6-phosphate 2-epimerase n=1 Tax=Bacillus sp. SD088 TaxID=2782012 RepID=UPI001A96D014|nr:N-acetylmannosamine-6-phosphate 2-epimerase [Bacillus sp. SD088]MBO0991770.1 N-acetylmannosamine-6-phosphate 2-epimerase [Bacillus sp. SD088]